MRKKVIDAEFQAVGSKKDHTVHFPLKPNGNSYLEYENGELSFSLTGTEEARERLQKALRDKEFLGIIWWSLYEEPAKGSKLSMRHTFQTLAAGIKYGPPQSGCGQQVNAKAQHEAETQPSERPRR